MNTMRVYPNTQAAGVDYFLPAVPFLSDLVPIA